MLPKEVLVIVDDGHGLETSGKRTPDGRKENTFNHPTKEIMMQELKRLNFNVLDVSQERIDTPLATRCERANKAYEDNKKTKKYKLIIFISIHFNAIGDYWDDKIGGIETYHYRESKKGKELATKVHNRLLKGTNLKDRGVKGAGFYVLKNTKMYAILLECGFMSNHVEADLMQNLAYQQECAIETVQGICDYIGYKWTPEVDRLTELAKIISPNYYEIWVKHFKASSKLNWVGFMESALKKNLP